MSKEEKLIPELVRETLNSLNEGIKKRDNYIIVLEKRVQELETELYYLKRDEHLKEAEQKSEEAQVTHNVEEGLKKMGLEIDDLEELGDMLDEVLGKEDTDDGNEG